MDAEDRYTEAVSHALAGFQIIEAGLKDYISDYHSIVREFLPEQMKYEFGRHDIQESALGRLVNMFARMNSNTTLIDTLRKLQPQRDELAHRALVSLYGREKETFKFDDHIDRLVDLANDLSFLMDDLLNERIKLDGMRKSPSGELGAMA